MKAYPERFNSLLGVVHAAFASGERARARGTLGHLLAMAQDGPRRQQAQAWGREAFEDGADAPSGAEAEPSAL